jgi:hypothetical protein
MTSGSKFSKVLFEPEALRWGFAQGVGYEEQYFHITFALKGANNSPNSSKH